MINFHPSNIEIWREWMLRLGDESHAAGINTICNLAIKALALENELRAANLAIEGMRGPLANAIVRPEGSVVKDAERYRYLRDQPDPDSGLPYVTVHTVNSWGKWFNTYETGEEMDKKVDAAIEQSRSPQQRDGSNG